MNQKQIFIFLSGHFSKKKHVLLKSLHCPQLNYELQQHCLLKLDLKYHQNSGIQHLDKSSL